MNSVLDGLRGFSSPPRERMAEMLKKLDPRHYYDAFVKEGVRPDGRKFDHWRKDSIAIGKRRTLVKRGSCSLLL